MRLYCFLLLLLPFLSSSELTLYPYLQPGNTPHSVILIWETALWFPCILEYGPTPACKLKIRSKGLKQERDGIKRYLHKITLSNLQPNTLYYYRIKSIFYQRLASGKRSFEERYLILNNTFRSFKKGTRGKFSFGVISDTHFEDISPERQKLFKVIEKFAPDFIIHCGDIVNEGSFFQFKIMNYRMRNLLSQLCCYSVKGNHEGYHDGGRNYLEFFYLPYNNAEETERYYSFDYGNTHFVILDTNSLAQELSQYQWLKSDLAKTRKYWCFVFFHHPIYTALDIPRKFNRRLGALLIPLFEKYKVTAVFQGHHHHYLRTRPLRSEGIVDMEKGTRYFMCNSGGRLMKPLSSLTPPWIAFKKAGLSFILVEVDKDSLLLKGVNEQGEVFDKITISKY